MSSNTLLNVLDIYLDTENPRHEPIYEQSDIIDYLLQGEKVKNLARNIAQNGVNPLDSVGVVRDEEGNYVVVEGNRRLCALLLLNDPDKAPPGDVPFFKKLAENSSKVPSSINCVLFDDSNEASVWMGIRHDGEQDGVGVRTWDAKQKTRHNGRVNKKDQNTLALSLIDYAVEKELLHSEKTEKIITTAARYLGNPFVRETLGIVSARSEVMVKINVTCQAFDRVLARFCDDLVANTTVNSRTRKEDWVAYGRLLIEEGVAPKERVDPHLLSECRGSAKGNPGRDKGTEAGSPKSRGEAEHDGCKDSPSSAKGRNVNPDNRKYIVPAGFRPKIDNLILRRAFQEMCTIEIASSPLAVSLVTRAFLENVYILFHEKVVGSYQPQKNTHQLMGKIIEEIGLDSGLTKTETNSLAALRKVYSNDASVLSPRTLGANAHLGQYPDHLQLKRGFDNISAIIDYMLRRLSS